MVNLWRSLRSINNRRNHHVNDNDSNPALALAQIYEGSFDFIDSATNRRHRLTVNANLDIMIDNKQLPGQIVGVTRDALTFIDHFGYHLIVRCTGGIPETIYDEAEDETYAIIYPEAEDEATDD
ncbi:DUF4828 domain-containing protein [Lacticaseibacillus pantheris]|jgi:hypothetical protein|uniref:DUF4828 domain-containing protein n=1 Tax=Lacticaseibacillus pantheris TaxID=171523 RepID=UPI0006CFD23E|nr:DUF4828 domain-containing protein [Lacticaseibacillus pantheris]WKF84272.1 DUF4828 domain-containing protein [Lacticaseibacillus pantheris]